MQTLDGQRFRKLAQKYVEGSATQTERVLLERWYENRQEYEDSNLFADASSEARIKAEIKRYFHRSINGLSKRRGRSRRLWPLASAAAILVALGVGYLIQSRNPASDHEGMTGSQSADRFTTISTGQRQVKHVVLPDSSIVWINAFSELKIPKNFASDGQRNIRLIEGEAYFEVKPDPLRPFVVHSASLTTEVLGTSFNINDYQSASRVSVTVSRGKVRVNDAKAEQEFGILTANQQLEFGPLQGKITRSIVSDIHAAADWRKGNVPLDEAHFEQLARAMKNTYGITLKADNDALKHARFSLVIKTSRNLTETMKLICSLHHSKFRRENDVITIY